MRNWDRRYKQFDETGGFFQNFLYPIIAVKQTPTLFRNNLEQDESDACITFRRWDSSLRLVPAVTMGNCLRKLKQWIF